jgi:hypothetical protein
MEGIESDMVPVVMGPVGEVDEVPHMGAHIRNQSVRKFFDTCSRTDASAEFRPMDITVKVPDR